MVCSNTSIESSSPAASVWAADAAPQNVGSEDSRTEPREEGRSDYGKVKVPIFDVSQGMRAFRRDVDVWEQLTRTSEEKRGLKLLHALGSEEPKERCEVLWNDGIRLPKGPDGVKNF